MAGAISLGSKAPGVRVCIRAASMASFLPRTTQNAAAAAARDAEGSADDGVNIQHFAQIGNTPVPKPMVPCWLVGCTAGLSCVTAVDGFVGRSRWQGQCKLGVCHATLPCNCNSLVAASNGMHADVRPLPC